MSSLSRPALLIIDIQVGLPSRPGSPMPGPRPWPTSIAWAKRPAVPLSPCWRCATGPAGSPIAAGSPFWQLAPELVVGEADRVFDKQRPSAFHGTGLDGWLKEDGVQTLIITGMKTQYCIDTTCRAAADLGYTVVLVSDAHTCMDTPQLTAPRSSPITTPPWPALRAADEQRRGVRGARPPP